MQVFTTIRVVVSSCPGTQATTRPGWVFYNPDIKIALENINKSLKIAWILFVLQVNKTVIINILNIQWDMSIYWLYLTTHTPNILYPSWQLTKKFLLNIMKIQTDIGNIKYGKYRAPVNYNQREMAELLQLEIYSLNLMEHSLLVFVTGIYSKIHIHCK